MKQNSDLKISISIIIITVLIFIGIVLFARSNSSGAGAQEPVEENFLASNEQFFDFGEISMAAGKVSHAFKIKNSNAETVTLAKIYTSCMCTIANLLKSGRNLGSFGMPGHGAVPKINVLFQPGEEADIEAIFDPAAHGPAGIGKIERSIYAESKSGTLLELRFAATVTP